MEGSGCATALRFAGTTRFFGASRSEWQVVFALDDTIPRVYLHHQSDLGEFFLSSDAVIPSFRKEPRIAVFLRSYFGSRAG